jgi:serine-type D-Ala-D-Ala carboxypeptidase (penicillin-binding protein 5/6)
MRCAWGVIILPLFVTILTAESLGFTGPAVAAGGSPVGGDRMSGTAVVSPPDVPPPPTIAAASWVLADLDSGGVLAARAPHVRLRPASTLKILTAVVLLPRINPKEHHIGTVSDASAEGSRVGIVPGARYSIDDLWNGLFLSSGNDAANALAAVAGGASSTVNLMNDEARLLQANDTTAVNPSGLDADGQLTSAYDLALIGRAGMRRPDFRSYVSRRTAPFPAAGRATFEIQNLNQLLRNYPGTIGIKTGYTTLAKHTLVAAARRGTRTLVCTLMRTTAPAWRQCAALLDWGFRYAPGISTVGALVEPLEVPPSAPGSGDRDTVRSSDTLAGQGMRVPSVGLILISGVLIGLCGFGCRTVVVALRGRSSPKT